MSWASVYWDLNHIVEAARLAMESPYSVEMAAQLTVSNPIPALLPTEKSVVENLSANLSGIANAANVDPLKTAETALSIRKQPTDSLEVSLSKSTLAAKPLAEDQPAVQLRNLWTPEIEAALREFLRPLSVNLRYEYRFPDTVDEKRSIAAINSLFKQPAKPDDREIRDASARNDLRRKHICGLRKSGFLDTKTKKS